MTRAPQAGLTIVELLIALTLGMFVMLAASALLVAANHSYLAQVEAARIDDEGRYALDVLSRALRQAGQLNWDGAHAPDLDAADPAIAGIDARSLGRNSAGIDVPLADVANGSDVLALRYAGAGAAPDGDGSVLNCAGFGVPDDGAASPRRWSIFYVGRGADGDTELRCKYHGARGWSADALVRGVDTFQLLYGLDTDEPPDGVANQFLSASALDALDAGLALAGADPAARRRELRRRSHWRRVSSVKVAILLHGARDTRAGDDALRFDLFGPGYADANGAGDRGVRIDEARLAPALRARARQLFSTTILLRNPSS